MQGVTVQHLFNTADIADGWYVAAVSVGPHDDPVVLCSEKPLGFDESRGPSGFTTTPRSTGLTRLRVHHLYDGTWTTVDLPPSEVALAFRVQPLSDRRWLLIRDTGRSGNAQVYSSDGRLEHAFEAGSGIEDALTDTDDQIWVSYFDEGVYGGPPSDAGLNCFLPDGSVVLRFNTDFAASLPFIDDCYALNVGASSDVWVCYYADFRLVQLVERKVQGSWQSPIQGAHGLAVSGDQVLFAGSYGSREQCSLVSLNTMEVRSLAVTTTRGQAIGPYRAIGRGPRLYMVTTGSDRWHGGTAVYALNIEADTGLVD